MARTPEFELTIGLISSPAALIVALWGMTLRPRPAAHASELAWQWKRVDNEGIDDDIFAKAGTLKACVMFFLDELACLQ
jgi:hypothetical protein